MINYSNVTFIKSVPDVSSKPLELTKEILIVGKSNVGKSSLINALCNKKKLAFTSSKPGHTKLLNYFNIDNKFYLVDAPGYGYANGGVDLDKLFGEMMEDYFSNNENIKGVLILIDSRRELSEDDIEIIDFLEDRNIKYYIVATKVDKLNQKEKSLLLKRIKQANIDENALYLTSSIEIKSLDKLRKNIELML